MTPKNKATILLVEDEALVRMNTAEELRNRGFAVLEAADAPRAIALLEAGAPADLVFADLEAQVHFEIVSHGAILSYRAAASRQPPAVIVRL